MEEGKVEKEMPIPVKALFAKFFLEWILPSYKFL